MTLITRSTLALSVTSTCRLVQYHCHIPFRPCTWSPVGRAGAAREVTRAGLHLRWAHLPLSAQQCDSPSPPPINTRSPSPSLSEQLTRNLSQAFYLVATSCCLRPLTHLPTLPPVLPSPPLSLTVTTTLPGVRRASSPSCML